MKHLSAIFRGGLVSVILALGVWVFVLGAARAGLLESLDLLGYDLLVSQRPASPPVAELVIVDFDDESVEALNAFPIPRRLLAEVIERIAAGGPELVGLDVLLDKPRDPADDQKLAEVIGRAGNVILAEVYGTDDLPGSHPLPLFRENALDVAFVNLPVDPDGYIRRFSLGRRTSEYQGLSFSVALATNYSKQPLQAYGRGGYRLGQIEIPALPAEPDSALIGCWSPQPARAVPVRELLAPGFDPTVFAGKIVLVGQSSEAGKDRYANTPVFRFGRPDSERTVLSGVEIHAAALASLLRGKTIRILGQVPLWALTFFLVWLVTGLVLVFRLLYGLPATAGALLGIYLLAQYLFSTHNLWLKFVSAELGIVLALPAALGYRFIEERRLKGRAEAEQRELMGLFERYVSPEVAGEIWRRRDEIILTGQERTATVLFSDIRNFTALTAGKPSIEVLAWLNDYFTAMSEIIKANGGFLNKFIGDGMLVVFGVPLTSGVEGDARRAVQTAIQMLKRVEALNAQGQPGRPLLEIGIGIHTGPLTAGNVGAQDRLEYSVIGETVNLASRLEALTKEFRTGVVLSPQTNELVERHFTTRPLGEATVRGFPGTTRVYTLAI